LKSITIYLRGAQGRLALPPMKRLAQAKLLDGMFLYSYYMVYIQGFKDFTLATIASVISAGSYKNSFQFDPP
jgi:hypothetical protein